MEKEKPEPRLIVRLELDSPKVPNFLRTMDGRAIPVQDVDDETLRAVGRRWTDLLVSLARMRRVVPR